MISSLACFPILTFEEAGLSPSLGYIFKHGWLDPHESLISMLWKFTYANHLTGHFLTSQIAARTVDPYEGCAINPSEVKVPILARFFGLSQVAVCSAIESQMSFRPWWPQLRYCPKCMSRGYHGVIHQRGATQRCAIHDCALLTMCRSCGLGIGYRINAHILDAPFKCPNCRRPYGNMPAAFTNRPRLSAAARLAIGRAFWA